MGDEISGITRLSVSDLDVNYTGKGLLMPSDDAIDLRDRVISAHREDYEGLEDVVESIATEIAEDEDNVSEEAWIGALRFKQELIEVFDLE